MRVQALGAGLVAQTQSSIPPFDLHRPRSVAEAVAVLAGHPEAVIAAGCTDLTAQLREGRVPRDLVSVRRVPDLQQVEHVAGVLRIGAGLTHHCGSGHPLLQATLPSPGGGPGQHRDRSDPLLRHPRWQPARPPLPLRDAGHPRGPRGQS
ncbi:FAD binding domain-containing protein [Nocardioides sp. B-3]|uniref:FAD binding domain-containing protein n=1 Tax=Nocardioides sp. B-3 TaxID=2895565 RepID=UPI0021537D96|nr:FAD binding domain-containing protein [Nocardioides sp. B-3]UUZ60309.1 FAD binding domain-containing protein [Nocardioides sp. B-3]